MKDHPLFKDAVHVFRDEELAQKWLNKKISALGNVSPIDYATTQEKEKKVQMILKQIGRGVFS